MRDFRATTWKLPLSQRSNSRPLKVSQDPADTTMMIRSFRIDELSTALCSQLGDELSYGSDGNMRGDLVY